MFAIFFSEKMDPFYEIVVSFPTVIFTVFLMLSIFYWCFAVLGLVDIDIFDVDLPEPELSVEGSASALSDLNVMAGALLKLGLLGIPLTIVITVFALIGWMISFTAVYFTDALIPDGVVQWLFNIVVFIVVVYISAKLTAICISPLKPLFAATLQNTRKSVIGQIAIVRTSEVTQTFGEANLNDGGAGLIIKVRSYKDETFAKGDRVALLDYNPDENAYRVISEKEFIK